MRWLLAGLSFALLVGLAVATAAINTGNVQARSRIQAIVEQSRAVQIALEAERVRYSLAVAPEELVRHWLALEAAYGY